MLLNTVMKKTAHWPFPDNTRVIIYVDDILMECSSPAILGLALQQLSVLCDQTGLIIIEIRTKFQTNGRRVFTCPAIMTLL